MKSRIDRENRDPGPGWPLSRPRGRRGSALIAVFWAIAILTMAVFTASQFLLFEVEVGASARQEFRAEQLAEAALAIAAHPRVEPWDPVLRQELGHGEGFIGRIESESARLNLNAMLDETSRSVLENLLEIWGLEELDAAAVVDSLIDWVDSDDVETGAGTGAEQRFYQRLGLRGRPFNRPFRDLDELKLVRGFDWIEAVQPRWRQAFTLHGAGRLDLHDASAELIRAVCGCSEEMAARFVMNRNGLDGIRATEDDARWESVEEPLDLLGILGPEREWVASRVSVNDRIVRLIGIGRVGDVEVERSLVIQGRDQQPVILEFSNRRLR